MVIDALRNGGLITVAPLCNGVEHLAQGYVPPDWALEEGVFSAHDGEDER